jgi:hypothetical protein
MALKLSLIQQSFHFQPIVLRILSAVAFLSLNRQGLLVAPSWDILAILQLHDNSGTVGGKGAGNFFVHDNMKFVGRPP